MVNQHQELNGHVHAVKFYLSCQIWVWLHMIFQYSYFVLHALRQFEQVMPACSVQIAHCQLQFRIGEQS